MDDILGFAPSVQEARSLIQGIESILQLGSFRAAKYAATDGKALTQLPIEKLAKQGVSITYMRHSKQLAKKYKMPYELEQIPNPGDGEIYEREQYNKYLVIAVLITIILVLFALSITEYVNLIFSPGL